MAFKNRRFSNKDPSKTINYRNNDTKCKKPLMVGAQAFMRAAKEGTTFAIYALPIKENSKSCNQILIQYQDFVDVFEKQNADILPEH